jgi:hypothetical protein
MPEEPIPYVAIIGGFRDLDPAVAGEAQAMARDIGAELAKAGFGLVVYESSPQSLEPHVVSGFVANTPAGAGAARIRVRFAEPQRQKVRFAEQGTRSELFEPKLFPGEDWEAPFYRSLVAAEGVDAVLLMAGARSTLIAGQIAVARPLPVLAIDAFGGAAGKIWTELAGDAKDYPSAATSNPAELVAWLKDKCLAQFRQRDEIRRRENAYTRAGSKSRKSAWAALAFGALLVSLVFGMALTPHATHYPFIMFGGLIAAGATGALVRAVVWGAEETAPATSFLLGGVAGFVVGLAYLIPQWVGAPGVLEASAAVVQATDKIQFASAVLVALSAGVGFDTVFTRLRKQAEDAPIGGTDYRTPR